MGNHLVKHGDGVKDVAFEVDNIEWIIETARKQNGKIVKEVTEESDENGSVKTAAIQTVILKLIYEINLQYGDTIHTLIERKNFKGLFLPGYVATTQSPYKLWDTAPKVGLNFIDHCVGNQPDLQMESVAQWYEKVFFFHR